MRFTFEKDNSLGRTLLVIMCIILLIMTGVYIFPPLNHHVKHGSALKTKITKKRPIHIESAGHLKDLVAKHPVVVVMFYADWCGHCQQMKPEFEKAANNTIHPLVMVDHTQNDILTAHNIRGLPTVKAIRGEHVEEFSGPRTAEALEHFTNSS